MGSTWSLDNFSFYPFVILGLIGLVGNIYSFVVFQSNDFNTPLYKYLRVYVINNMAVCLLGTIHFVFSTFRILTWSNSHASLSYLAFFYVPIQTLCYVFGGLIDIFILLDRIATLSPRAKKLIEKLEPYKVCALLFLASVVIEIPDDLGNMPSSVSLALSATQYFTAWFLNNTPFATSRLGVVIFYIMYIVRDLGGLLAQIALNLISLCLLKAHSGKKKKIVAHGDTHANMSVTENASTLASTTHAVNAQNSKRINHAEVKAVVMVGVICVVSAVEHMVTLITFMIPMFYVGFATFVMYRMLEFVYPIRCVLNVVLFYFFNLNFQKIVNAHFRRVFGVRAVIKKETNCQLSTTIKSKV
jgi:hypothetical protein